MRNKSGGVRIIIIGIVLAIAGLLWAQAPIRGLCPMNFRSVDAYNITLISPPLGSGSAWNRTWDWAPDESIARVYSVLSALLAYNIVGLIYLRRKRTKTANNELESIVA
jgi:hypothetical protein